MVFCTIVQNIRRSKNYKKIHEELGWNFWITTPQHLPGLHDRGWGLGHCAPMNPFLPVRSIPDGGAEVNRACVCSPCYLITWNFWERYSTSGDLSPTHRWYPTLFHIHRTDGAVWLSWIYRRGHPNYKHELSEGVHHHSALASYHFLELN